MEVGTRVTIKTCNHPELIGLKGVITGFEGQWTEVRLDGDKHTTPFTANELEQEASWE